MDAVLTFASALVAVGLADEDRCYWAGHAVFVHRPEERARYREVFCSFFSGTLQVPPEELVAPPEPPPLTLVADDEQAGEDRDELAGPIEHLRYSAVEILSDRPFVSLTEEELLTALQLVAAARHAVPLRPSRRLRRTSSSHPGALDLRRTVRRALRTGGVPTVLERRRPGTRPRTVVMLLDVSGSMGPSVRPLLSFAHSLARAGWRLELFSLGTRCTRVTRALRWRHAELALRQVHEAVEDLGGGTRLGEGLASFNDRYGVAGMARGACVVIASDGWDRGDPAQLAAEMARCHRVAHKMVWVNPLKATEGYAPLARGMAAALPFVDDFVSGSSVAALTELAAVLSE
jgi:uncharacterized protein with von Willebrand factor type A (vWA) domain